MQLRAFGAFWGLRGLGGFRVLGLGFLLGVLGLFFGFWCLGV